MYEAQRIGAVAAAVGAVKHTFAWDIAMRKSIGGSGLCVLVHLCAFGIVWKLYTHKQKQKQKHKR